MKRLWQGLFILIFSSLFSLGCMPISAVRSELSQPNQRHILQRLSYGITREQIEQVNEQGIEAYIQSQLNPEQLPESPYVEQYQSELELINQPVVKTQSLHAKYRQQLRTPNISIAEHQRIDKITRNLNLQSRKEAMRLRLVKAIYSPRQLEELMVDFWFNHFNVFANKGVISLWVADYEKQIRSHALGNFRDLLEVTASHPAMLIYLDNERNTASNRPGSSLDSLNENYARELMELHTMGVDGGYTHEDIVALSRIFTGWGVDYENKIGNEHGFFFYENLHDPSSKVFLGHQITTKGIEEGREALDVLTAHPATAKFISYKLAQYFLVDKPPSSLVDSLAKEFLASNGNIKSVLDTLIHSSEFNDSQYYGKKFKNPYQYLISLVRMSEIKQPNYEALTFMLSNLAMPMYMCDAPTGYKNTEEAWLNPQGILHRIGYSSAIARGSLTDKKPIQYEQLTDNFGELSLQTESVIAKSTPGLRSSLILGSPEAMYR